MTSRIAYIGLGTNLVLPNSRIPFSNSLSTNLDLCLKLLRRDPQIKLIDTSGLYESKPTKFDNVVASNGQLNFLNCVVKIETTKSPVDLLSTCKDVEHEMGRQPIVAERHGPRVADLDLLLYDVPDDSSNPFAFKFNSDTLTIPHPSLHLRDFVMLPLRDVLPAPAYNRIPGDHKAMESVLGRVATYGPYLQWHLGEGVTKTVAIMNATPDSFSDGGLLTDPDMRAQELINVHHADALDIGGESTRPGATALESEVEVERVIPAARAALKYSNSISIDTTKYVVAKECLELGCHVINDVHGGRDLNILRLVADNPGTGVSLERIILLRILTSDYSSKQIVLMHSRGDSQTMDSLCDGYDGDIVSAVAESLKKKISRAIEQGIPRWRIIADPGIGFAKTPQDNYKLLSCSDELRDKLGGCIPIMIGHSRKRFLKPAFLGIDIKQDWPSIEVREEVNLKATREAIDGGADMVRVHF